MIDEDHNMSITKDELQKFLNINENHPLLNEIFGEVDTDGDGNISLTEFLNSVDNLFSKAL